MTDASAALNLLGGFLLTVRGERREVPARKAKALLCRLALEPGPLSRDALAALLWPDSAPAAARHSLRQALSELRRTLDRSALALEVTSQEAALDTATGAIDVRNFEALAASADPADWARAMDTYRGTLLEGLDIRVDTFDAWLDAQRRRLEHMALRLCRALAEHHDDDAEAIAWLKRLTALDPLDEAAHRDLMRSFIGAGQDGAAIRQYLHCRSLLARELGIEPEAETTGLYESLLTHRAAAQTTAPAEPAAADAPADAPPDEAPAAAPRRLRPAVVLACQLAMADADPEAADAERRRQVETVTRVVRSYGGRMVAELAGCIVCGFGLDRVRGTEADRACLAAAELTARLPELRVGIASGQVVFRADELSLVGQATAEAQALCAGAQPGTVAVTDVVSAARRSPGPAAPGVEADAAAPPSAPLIGRTLELRQFVAVLDACRDGGYGCAVLVRGEAGIGKTRLVQEYRSLAEREGFAVHLGQAYDFGAARGHDALAQLVRSLLGRSGEDAAALAALVGEPRVPYLQAMLGREPEPGRAEELHSLSPYERLERSADAVVALVRAAADHSALLLVVDDLHWADRFVLAVLPHLARAAAELPVALVMTSRVAGEALDPEWRAAMGGAPLTTLDLQPLRPADATRLASALGAAAERQGRLVERAGGNPLFIQQLVRSGRLGQELPYSIQGLAVAQLEALPEVVQTHVCAASVLGQHCARAPLEAIIGTTAELDAAVQAGLMVRHQDGWRFHHALIRDGIYQNLLPSERRALHARAAAFFRDASLTLHAQHLDLAEADGAAAALVEAAFDEMDHYRLARARPLIVRALEREPGAARARLAEGQLELQLGNTARAADCFRRSRALAWTDAVRARALVGLGMALNQMDDHAGAVEALRAAVTLNEGDHDFQADAWLQLGNALFPQGLGAACLEAHQMALAHAEQAGSTLRQARAEGGLGDAYYQQGAMLTAYRHFDRCVMLGRSHDHPSVVPPNQAMRALTLMYQNRFADALADGAQALELAQRSSEVRHQLLAHNVLASIESFHGGVEAGLAHARQSLDLSRRMGSKRFVVDAWAQIVHLLWAGGRHDEARRALAAVEDSLDASLLPFAGAYVRGLQALCATTAGQRRDCLADGERLLGRRAVSHCHVYFYVAAMEACLAAGETAAALGYADGLAAYTAAEPMPFTDFFIRAARLRAGAADAGQHEALLRMAQAAELGAGVRLLQ